METKFIHEHHCKLWWSFVIVCHFKIVIFADRSAFKYLGIGGEILKIVWGTDVEMGLKIRFIDRYSVAECNLENLEMRFNFTDWGVKRSERVYYQVFLEK